MHVMPGVGDVAAETCSDQLLNVGDTVAVRILEAPDVRNRRDINPAIEIHHAGGDTRNGSIKALSKNGDLIGDAIMIRIRELIDGFLLECQVLPINRAVLVMIFETTARYLELSGSQFALIESKFLLRRGQGDIISNPE